jgi:hypothetical protein
MNFSGLRQFVNNSNCTERIRLLVVEREKDETKMTMMLFDDRALPQNRNGSITKLSDAEIAAKFLEFWAKYPKRAGGNPKSEAERKFRKAVNSGISCETIIAGARRFAAECLQNRIEARFVPMAVTWLNQKRWADDPDAGPGVEPKSFIEMARDLRERADQDGERGPDDR